METIITKSYQGAQTRLLLPKVKDVAGVIGDNNSTKLVFKIPKLYDTGWVKFIEFDCYVIRDDIEVKPTYPLDENNSFVIPYEITESNIGKEVDYNLKFVSDDGEITEKSEMATLYFRDSSNGTLVDPSPYIDIVAFLYSNAFCNISYSDGTTIGGGSDQLPKLTFTPMNPTGDAEELSLNIPYLDENGIILNKFINKEIVVEVFKRSSPNDLTSITDAQVPDMALLSEGDPNNPWYMDLYMLVGHDPTIADNWYLIHTDNPTFKNVHVSQNVDITGTLDVGQDAQFDADVNVAGDTTVVGETQSGSIVSESSIETQTLDVKSTSEFEGEVTFDNNIIQDTNQTATLGSTTTQDIHATTLDTSEKATIDSLEVEGQSQFDGNVTIGTHSTGSPDTHAILTVNGDVYVDSDKKIFVDTIQSQTDANPVTINDDVTLTQSKTLKVDRIESSTGGNNFPVTINDDLAIGTSLNPKTLTSYDKITGRNGLDITNGATNLQDTNVGATGSGNEKNLHVYGSTTLDGQTTINDNVTLVGDITQTGDTTQTGSFNISGTLAVDTIAPHTENGPVTIETDVQLSQGEALSSDTIYVDTIQSRSSDANVPVRFNDTVEIGDSNTDKSLKIYGTAEVTGNVQAKANMTVGTAGQANSLTVNGTISGGTTTIGALTTPSITTGDNNPLAINDSVSISDDLTVSKDVILSKQNASSILRTNANKNIESTIIGSQDQILTVTDGNKTIGWQTPAGPSEGSLGVASRGALFAEQQRATTAENTKVDKLNDTGLYAYTHNGASQSHLPIAEGSTGSTIAQRDADGRLTIVGAADTDGGNQAITKTQLTNGLNTKVSRDFSSSLFYGASISDDSGASGVTIDFDIKDTNTGSPDTVQLVLPVADNQTAGVATSSQIAQIEQNTADIAALQGKSTRYAISVDVTQYQTTQALQTALTEAWWVASGHTLPVTPGSEPDDYTTLVNLFSPSEPNNHEYTWMDYQGSEKWIDRGASTVAIATNESLGIVQGTPDNNSHTNDGNIFVDSDGTMEVLGWGRALARVSNLESTMPTKVSRIDTTTQNTGFAYIHNGTNDDELEIAKGNVANTIVQRDQSGDITTRQFHGALDGNANTASSATEFTNAQTVELTGDVTGSASSKAGWTVATTLSNSGVTSGNYGPQSNPSPAHHGTFTVPSFSVDAKGRITSATDRTVTLPDTQAKVPAGTSGQFVMASGTAGTLDYYNLETTGNGNAVTSVSVDTTNDKVTVNKGTTFVDTVSQTSSAGYVSNVSKNGATLEVTRTAIPNVAVTGGTATAGKYVSGIATNGHGITVSQENLPVLSETDTGSGNVVTDIAVSGHAITWTKGKFLGADIPDPADEQTSVVGQALIVNLTGDGYVFGEAGKVDEIQINGTKIAPLNDSKVANIVTGAGLVSSTNTIKAKLKSETNATNDSETITDTSGRQYAVVPDKTNGYLSVNVPWLDLKVHQFQSDTDTSTYSALMAYTTGTTTETMYARKTQKVTITPSTGTLTASHFYNSSTSSSLDFIVGSTFQLTEVD